ncbi:MAG: hypothetical protein L6W00_17830 [Lentisphaeria bacterium]|nr:MAG: hypothetical protein L6W00_17830 [Lentisphaeria bacterium]
MKRSENQDAYRCLPARGLFIISDGMGGGEGGRRAAEMVVRILEQAVAVPMKHLSDITRFAHQANAEIRDYAGEHNLRGMGATIAGILLSAFHPGTDCCSLPGTVAAIVFATAFWSNSPQITRSPPQWESGRRSSPGTCRAF